MPRRQRSWSPFPAYVPVAQRKARAAKEAARLAKTAGKRKLDAPEPVTIAGRLIAATFWGKAWCDNLEAYADFAHRLGRGRSYVRSGAVVDLRLSEGRVVARVLGSSLYEVDIAVSKLPDGRWRSVAATCAGQIASLVGLLRGQLPEEVLRAVTDRQSGLFPEPGHFRPSCTCPDVAQVCKHVAAVLYGVGARLDTQPELLFLLRGVRAEDLIDAATAALPTGVDSANAGSATTLDASVEDLGALFGIDLGAPSETPAATKPVTARRTKPRKTPGKKTSAKR